MPNKKLQATHQASTRFARSKAQNLRQLAARMSLALGA